MISSNTYEEVYEILSYMDKITVMRVPEEILNTIKNKRNVNFKTRIDKNDIFNEENISKEAIDFLCWIDYKYWMDENRKTKIDQIKFDKIRRYEEEKREKYATDNLFKKQDKVKNTEEVKTEEVAMVEYKESIFKRFINIIKSIFKIK